MPENARESKETKIAAARKKLKEYQKRNTEHINEKNAKAAAGAGSSDDHVSGTSTTGSVASNLSERSESEQNLNGNTTGQHSRNPSGDITPTLSLEQYAALPTAVSTQQTVNSFFSAPNISDVENLFNSMGAPMQTTVGSSLPQIKIAAESNVGNINAIQVLISEKTQLTNELTKMRSACRERDLELEEMRTQYQSSNQRFDDLQKHYVEQQRVMEQLRKNNAELQHKVAQISAQNEDQQTHIDELQRQLKQLKEQMNEAMEKYTEKCNELEMTQLRVRQLSDESNISNDNRVETLTQTKYMYEQQIRDLQAMVQQLTEDKEQANTQYQTFVQHLKAEHTKMTESNDDLNEENHRLQERERQLVEHVSALEREIQKNLNLQAQFREINKSPDKVTANTSGEIDAKELEDLKTRLADYDFERHEFQLKIKSQDDNLHILKEQLDVRQETIEALELQLARLQDEQPDTSKLLATMESDKVAAARALTQNVNMKQQLDELEQRFVQLTNDKAELVNKLDAEEFANREMRAHYTALQEKLHTIDERFKFKDEEMIRLSRENMELTRENFVLQQQVDRLQHYEVKEYYTSHEHTTDDCGDGLINDGGTKKEQGHTCICNHTHDIGGDHAPDHNHMHANEHKDLLTIDNDNTNAEQCIEATEQTFITTAAANERDQSNICTYQAQAQSQSQVKLPTAQAVEKLEARFTHLISQVADLTDEKQRLEHLVLQLQSETETIGEYITLYQTQRRMLKQREYEKASQMQLLQAEREQLRDKITLLNNLVSSLGVNLPQQSMNKALNYQINKNEHQKENNSMAITPSELTIANNLQSHESQQILNKIQNIITEIKYDTEHMPALQEQQHTVDHFNCCLGKFEVV